MKIGQALQAGVPPAALADAYELSVQELRSHRGHQRDLSARITATRAGDR